MRQVIDPQLQFGEQDIAAIHLDPKSRDDIPQILCGLQFIYTTPELREAVFAILEEVVPQGVEGKASPDTGRPGMEQWKILVLGALRLGLNADYDRIHELSNQHNTIRQMLGHSDWADETTYELDNLGQPAAVHPGDSRSDQPRGGARRACAGKKKPGRRAERPL